MNKKNKLSSFVNSQTNIIPNNIIPKLKNELCQSQHSISTSNSIYSNYIENPNNLNLFSYNKNLDSDCKKLLNIPIDDSFSSFKTIDYQKNKNYFIDNDFEKKQKVFKDLNSELVKMNYCNLIQTNSIQRLDLSLSFLSSQIETLKLLNKKRKIKLQNILDKFKSSDN
jgi:hypothetical protein